MKIAKNILLGVAVGDALGVPVEFNSREKLKAFPVTEMTGYGTYNQPAGTWSDDSSLTFCLADSLTKGYDLKDIAQKFVQWYYHNLWTPHGNVFDIGMHTKDSILNLRYLFQNKQEHLLKGGLYTEDEMANGNGALMRIAPLVLLTRTRPLSEKLKLIREVSALTHGHIRSAIACLLYLLVAEYLIAGLTAEQAYLKAKIEVRSFLDRINMHQEEVRVFTRVLELNIGELEEDEIRSGGYVMHSIEASLWCLLRSNSYKETVLKAVNLGEDTDTTAAIAGGLAGLAYTHQGIPKEWIDQLAKKKAIIELAARLDERYS